jgi:hypothetical protein
VKKSIIKDKKVVNVVEIKDGVRWLPPKGHTIGPDGGEMGDTLNDDNTYSKPEEPAIPDSEKAQKELNALDGVLRRTDEDMINVVIQHTPAELSDFGPVIEKNYNDKQAARIRRNA